MGGYALVAEGSPDTWAGPVTVADIARCVGGTVDGDAAAIIVGVSSIEEAEDGDIVFAENGRYLGLAGKSRASAIVSYPDARAPAKPLIRVEDPRYAFARILTLFEPPVRVACGVHETAVIGRGTHVPHDASIGPNVTLGERVTLGAGIVIGAGTVIGDGCELGAGCVLYPNVTLYHGTRLGERVIVHSGAVLGADGFGYIRVGDASRKVPHVGIVEVGDDVEIGANATVDRAKTGATVIGARTKIDNLVQVAHNCKIGPDCILAAQVGIAGSTRFGQGVVAAGQAGFKDHVSVGDGAVLIGRAGVIGDVPAGATFSGYPARSHREKLRQEVETARLGEYSRRVRALETANVALVAQNERLERLVNRLAERLGVEPEL